MRVLLSVLLLASAARAADIPIGLDPRIETLGFVQMLAGGEPPHSFRIPDGEYARRARAAFEKFRGHPAVALTAAIPHEFDYRNRIDAVIRRGPLPDMAPLWFTPDWIVKQVGGRDKYEAWMASLADFARQARVEDFIRDNASALDPELADFKKDVYGRGYVAKLERYAGYPLDGRYEVVVAPFVLRGSQENAVLRLDDGTYRIISVVGPDVNGGRLSFRPEDFVATAGHELSHGLFDTLGDLYRDRIEGEAGTYKKLPWPCYNDWLQCAKENVVRAVMLRLIGAELGEGMATRHLDEEGRAKYPYLEEMTKRLRQYEADRKRWPNMASFYPTLIDVFPKDPAPGFRPEAVSLEKNGPDWMYEETRPFSTPGQRAHALEHLDRVLAVSKDPLLFRRRSAFRLLQSDAAGAESDANAAVALDPKDPAAFLARGLARSRLGRADEARGDFDAAVDVCRAGVAPDAAVACANARRLSEGGVATASAGADPAVGPNPDLGPSGVPAAVPETAVVPPVARTPELPKPPVILRPAKPSTIDYEFAADPGIEVLAAVAALARPAAGAGRSADFAALNDHPAVRRVKALLDRGVPEMALSQLVLSVGAPPEFAEDGPVSSGLAGPLGGESEAEALLADFRAFAKAADWAKIWERRKAVNAALAARAREETRRTLSPEAVEAWFGTKFKDRYVFLVSDDLPTQYGANTAYDRDGRHVEIRLRSVMGWKDKTAYFSFDDFAGSVAHELTHTITDPVGLARAGELEAYSSLMVKGCTDSWTGCVLEHVNIAATLRALRAEEGEAAYQATLKDYSRRGFPYLPALVERMAEYETPSARARGFAAFFPRVEDVFRQALRGKFKTQAKANVAAAATAAAPAREEFSEEYAVDPRLELAAVLRRLALPADARAREAAGAKAYAARLDARFAAFAASPAVALTAKLDATPGVPGLPASLIVHLSTGPDLALRVAVPAGYVAAAGGDEALEKWFSAVRAFAKASGFFDVYRSESDYYAGLLKEAKDEAARATPPAAVAAYVGRPLEGRHLYALSPLYPSSYPSRLTVYGDSGAQTLRPRGARPVNGATSFALDSDKGATAAELIYDEASRLVPGAAPVAGGLVEACSDRRGPAWPVCEREHLVEALSQRIRKSAPKAPVDGVLPALPYLTNLLAKLSVYETSRSSYPVLDAYWPEAEKAFGAKRVAPTMSEGELSRFAEFSVDPRVELVSVLLRLGGAVRAKGRDRNEIERLADEKFAAFAAHPAAVRVNALSRSGAAPGQLPLRLALALGDPPGLAVRRLPPEPWLKAAGGEEGVRAFAADLRAFAREAHFASYYDAARPIYRSYVSEARAEALRGESPRAALSYLGSSLPKGRFLLSGLLPESYGTDFDLESGSSAVRAFIWPAAVQTGTPRFRFDAFGDSPLHELVHAVTDPLVPNRFDPGGPVTAGCNDAGGSPSWRACAQEYLVYAVTLRLLAADAGEEAARIEATAYVERGYPRLPELIEKLKAYERDRKAWPRFEAFAPELLEIFSTAPAKRAAARESQAQKLMARGVNAFLAGDVAGAVKLLRDAEKLSPEDAGIALNLSVSLGRAGDAEGEAAECDRAIVLGLSEKNKQWEIAAAALSSRAERRLAAGQKDLAKADLEKALAEVPKDWNGRAELEKRLEALKK
jgi:hypothetical protein